MSGYNMPPGCTQDIFDREMEYRGNSLRKYQPVNPDPQAFEKLRASLAKAKTRSEREKMAYLSPYWATFKNTAGCIEAETETDARVQAEKMGIVVTLKRIPYPANPRLSEKQSDCPDFCYSPRQCQGRTACPQSYACSE